MKPRVLAALFAIAIALFAFIVLVDRRAFTTKDVEGRDRRVLERFVGARVASIEIAREGRVVEVVRDVPNEGEPGAWRVTKPVRADADQDAVESLLSALEWVEPTRTLGHPSANDLRAFGLAPGTSRVTIRGAGETTELDVGREGPDGSVYLRVRGRDPVFVVGKDVRDALAKDVGDLRTKVIVEPPLEAITTIARATPAGRVRIDVRTNRLEAPRAMSAAPDLIAAMVRSLQELRASRHSGAGENGLSPPDARFEVTRSTGGTITLDLGAPCAGHADERYARVGEGPVVCVREDSIRPLLVPIEALEDRRLIDIENGAVIALEIARGGDHLLVERVGSGFHGRITSAGHEATFDVDETALSDYLDALRRARATDVRANGPVLRDRVSVRTADTEKSVSFGEDDAGAVLVRADAAGPTLVFPSAVRELLRVSPLPFRRLRLLDDRFDRIESISIARGASVEEIVRHDDVVAVVAPTRGEADETRFAALCHSLASLEALRYVAERAEPAHGLAHPRFVITFHLRAEGVLPAAVHVLRVGAPTSGGAYATLDADPSVLVVHDALVELITEPLRVPSAESSPR